MPHRVMPHRVMPHMHALRTVLLLVPLSLASCGSVVDETAQSPATCEVHHVALTPDTVPIAYGDRVFDPRYEEARKGFPHANLESRRGCVIDSDSPTRARVLYCPECRKAESAF